jgi:hypothetical protein
MVKKHTGDRIVNLTKEKLAMQKEYKKEFNAHLGTKDLYSAALTEIEELTKINKDLQARFIKGGLNYIERDGYVVGITQIFSDSEYTYDQPIPKEIGTAKYNACPFYVMNNRQLDIDITKKARYDSI